MKTTHCFLCETFPAGFVELSNDRPVTIGRRQTNDVILNHPSVSREHASLRWEDESFLLQAKDGPNSTLVNGEVLQGSRRLEVNDVVEIGPFRLRYRTYEGSEAAVALGEDLVLQESLAEERKTSETQRFSASHSLDEAREGVDFSGRKMISFCYLISFRHEDGVLVVEGSTSGEIVFLGGDILRAEAGDLLGREAAMALLSLTEGHYRFAPLSSARVMAVTSSLLQDILYEEEARRTGRDPRLEATGGGE